MPGTIPEVTRPGLVHRFARCTRVRHPAMFATDDIRIDRLRPLLPPAILMEELPLDEDQARQIATARSEIGDVLQGRDDRVVIVVGPCSVHDTKAALDYAARLKKAADRHRSELVVV